MKTAYSSLGYKHTEKTLVKVHKNLETLNLSKSVKVVVSNLETNVSTEYVSLREAAKSLNTNKTTLKEYILKNIPYKGIYKLESNLAVSKYDSNYLNHPASLRSELYFIAPMVSDLGRRTKKIEVIDLELNTVTNYISIPQRGIPIWIP